MTYESEEVRHAFHALPTQTQYEWTKWDNELADTGYELHIEGVKNSKDFLEVCIRVNQQLKTGRTPEA